jgi:LacI family transcriptional regulator
LADGIILTHTAPRDPRVQLLADAGLPFVTHGRTEFYSPHPYHDFDSQAFVEMAVERLAARGCRDVMLFSANDHTTNHHTIVQSFTQAATRHNIRTRVAEKFDVDSSSQAQRRFGAKLAQMVDRPDGIICDNEILALALFSGLREGGIRPGLDIPVVVKQNSDILPTVFPDIDLIGEDVIEAGNELARLLLERINDTPAESLQTLGAPHPQWDA